MMAAPARPRVAVVGGGITGLATAHRLLRSVGEAIELAVFEAEPRPGGKIRTTEVGGVPVEAGADSFVVRKPWAVDLCNELGLADELVVPGATGTSVWTGGRLRSFPARSAFGIPSRIGDLMAWKGLPLAARLRAALDVYRPARRGQGDEALGRLLRRRLGARAARVMVEPLLAGLHAGDPDRLSTQATFPEIAEWERRHGSLIKGARAALKASAEARSGPMFATLWGGLDRMTGAIAARLGSDRLRLGTPVLALRREAGHHVLETTAGRFEAEAVVLAVPAFDASRLLSGLAPEASGELSAIPYASTAVVILVYPEGTAERLPDGTGYVSSRGAGIVTACTWVSRKWPTEDLGSRAVLRCFVGRAGEEKALQLTDPRLVDAVQAETEAVVPMGVRPEAEVIRWPRGMPQYEVGHLDRVERVRRALDRTPGIFVAGSAYGGIGIPDCIRQGDEAAGRVGTFLGVTHGPGGRTEGSETNEQEAIGWRM